MPRERYRLLYRKVFADTLGDLSQGMAVGTDVALPIAALARPRDAMAPAEIRALAAEAIAHLHEVTGKLTELSALLKLDAHIAGVEADVAALKALLAGGEVPDAGPGPASQP